MVRSGTGVPRRDVRQALHGISIPLSALALVGCAMLGGKVFSTIYLLEGAARPGYDPLARSISLLSLGPGGWLQRVGFAVYGLLTIASAFGWRRVLEGGRGRTAYPILVALVGLGSVGDALFSQDPVPGYPPGTGSVTATWQGEVHLLFATVTITALLVSCFVLGARLWGESGWGAGWGVFAVACGIACMVFIALFGGSGANGGVAGLWERLSGAAGSLPGVSVFLRLAMQAWRWGPRWAMVASIGWIANVAIIGVAGGLVAHGGAPERLYGLLAELPGLCVFVLLLLEQMRPRRPQPAVAGTG